VRGRGVIASFIMVSLDGYFDGDKPWDLGWHHVDQEFNDFANQQLDDFDVLVFGRATYEGMAAYWPSADAIKSDPEVASRMNEARKIVVSRSLNAPAPAWNNASLVKDIGELRSDDRLLVLGSAVLTMSLLESKLLDELRVMINPVLIGSGRPIGGSLRQGIELELAGRRDFANGNALLTYRPA
jgi:dihydrofolate reductase